MPRVAVRCTVTVRCIVRIGMTVTMTMSVIVTAMTVDFIAGLVLRWAAANAEPHAEGVVGRQERCKQRDPTECRCTWGAACKRFGND
jgi:hypothetical protein